MSRAVAFPSLPRLLPHKFTAFIGNSCSAALIDGIKINCNSGGDSREREREARPLDAVGGIHIFSEGIAFKPSYQHLWCGVLGGWLCVGWSALNRIGICAADATDSAGDWSLRDAEIAKQVTCTACLALSYSCRPSGIISLENTENYWID